LSFFVSISQNFHESVSFASYIVTIKMPLNVLDGQPTADHRSLEILSRCAGYGFYATSTSSKTQSSANLMLWRVMLNDRKFLTLSGHWAVGCFRKAIFELWFGTEAFSLIRSFHSLCPTEISSRHPEIEVSESYVSRAFIP
jgi:hypothetical protein